MAGLFITLCFWANLTSAQALEFTPPDFKKIEKVISKKGAYEQLMSRFKAGDSTLTNEEVYLLYYGYTLQKDYKPFWQNKRMQEINTILNKEGEPDRYELEALAKQAEEGVEAFPFSVDDLKYLGFAMHKLGNNYKASLCMWKVKTILFAILMSGDGHSKKSAWHIINVAHEYAVLDTFELKAKGQSLTKDLYDYIELEENEFGLNAIYFNVSTIFKGKELK